MGAIVQNGLLTLGELRRAAGCLETVLEQNRLRNSLA